MTAMWAKGKGTVASFQMLITLLQDLSTEDQESLTGLFQILLSVPEKKSWIHKDTALI